MFADGLGLIWRQDIRNNYDWYDIGPVGIPRSAQPTDTGMYVGWVVQNRQVWLSVANNVFSIQSFCASIVLIITIVVVMYVFTMTRVFLYLIYRFCFLNSLKPSDAYILR